jgi:hypothetical protein
MKEIYTVFKEVLEIIYYLASVGLLIGVLIALKQLKLMKKDFQTTNHRASIEKSMEYLNLFATEFIPKAGSTISSIRNKNVQFYKGPINKEFRFDNNCSLASKYIKSNLDAAYECDAVSILNRFEYFSAAFVSGLANEELAFNPLAKLYCNYIEDLYIVLCSLRKDEDGYAFDYTVELYNIWKSRLEKNALEKKRSKLDDEMSKIQEKRINYIGRE